MNESRVSRVRAECSKGVLATGHDEMQLQYLGPRMPWRLVCGPPKAFACRRFRKIAKSDH